MMNGLLVLRQLSYRSVKLLGTSWLDCTSMMKVLLVVHLLKTNVLASLLYISPVLNLKNFKLKIISMIGVN